MIVAGTAQPILLDAFCGAGGCARGYQRAGFYVVGVDLKAQPRYAGDEFHQADALDVLRRLLAGETWEGYVLADFAAIHASPPCQHYANVTLWRGQQENHPALIAPVRALLIAAGLPWVIENVERTPIRPDFILCGSRFGLNVRRHRWFETSWHHFDLRPGCSHRGLLAFEHKQERAYTDAMGCGWMTNHEGREAVPPAYTEHIGSYLMLEVQARRHNGSAGAARPKEERADAA